MGRVYRPPMTCIPLHVKKAPCAEHLHTACALVTFIDSERAAVMLWMWRRASESGVFNIGTGTGRSFHDLMLALGAACGRVPVIAYVDMPEAPSGRLRALGNHAPCMLIEEAVREFATHHLSPPDP
jgi:nucleoside-diphosphate-sugar epimerase